MNEGRIVHGRQCGTAEEESYGAGCCLSMFDIHTRHLWIYVVIAPHSTDFSWAMWTG